MKNILIICLTLLSMGVMAQNNYKRYEIKSAKVEYKTVSPQGNGTKTLLFDNYGTRERVHEKIYNGNQLVVDKLTLLDGEKAFSVDLLTNRATDISASIKMAKEMTGNDMSAAGKEILESMGGKMAGHKTMLGKTCEVWQVNTMGNTTLLVYKSIPLSTQVKVMGFTTSEEATAFKEGVTTSESDFNLPQGVTLSESNYNNDMGGMMEEYGSGMTDQDKNSLEKMQKMTYEEFKAFVLKNDPNANEDEIKLIYNMMKAAAGNKNK